MCEKCVEIDHKIEQYARIARSVTDQLTLDRIKSAVVEMTAKKVALHPQK
jgi:hypothetical protein